MNVLILGVNGFIGSSLARRILHETTWNVVGMDLSDARVRALTGPRFRCEVGDLTEERAWVEREVARADVVLPLAACATPASYVKEPLETFELVFEENLRVVRMCARHGVRVVFPSTSEVYAMCPDERFNEETSPLVLGPISKERWIYACAKQMLDRVIWAYGRQGLRFTLFRPFNWFGPGLDDPNRSADGSSRVVSQFLGHLMRGEPLRLVNGGAQRRCFTYLDDGLDGLMRILRNDGGRADGRIFNLGNPENDASVAELAREMADVLAAVPGWEHVRQTAQFVSVTGEEYYGAGYEDTPRRLPDVTAAREHLGWVPRVSLREGLTRMVAHYAAEAAAARSNGGGHAVRFTGIAAPATA
jgi:nucleoside-diphosphate-sugar epimerase